MIRLKLPPDASRSLNIRLRKDEYEFIDKQYHLNQTYYRSLSGVVKEALKLYKMKNIKKISEENINRSSLWM